ncbi:alpha/beta fold hydrolase [Flavobacterium sp. U410]
MYKIICLVFSIITCNNYAQISLSGMVTNENNEPIPYCSIGVKNLNIGAISDEKGNYKLIIPNDINEKIIFSAIGYLESSKSKDELIEDANVVLEYKSITLAPVIIYQTKMKDKVIGQKSKPMLTFSKMFDQNVPTIEQGNIFNVYQKTKLKSYSFYIIPSSKFEEITLKLNMYSAKDGIPDKILLSENIIYKTNNTGWQTIDLIPYELIFDDLKQIAVTLQLVNYKPLENTDFVFGISAKKSITDDLLFRYQNQGNWEKSKGVFIANLAISYVKKSGEKEIKERENENQPQNDADTQSLINYYTNKEKANKTNYGKDKSGKYIDIGDAKIYYESYGKGEPLILLHGNNGSISDFYKLIPELAKHFNVIAIDTRGQGRSTDLTTSDYTYKLFAADLLRIIQHLNLEKINILGWSDGGNTGLVFNSKHPEKVNKLITIGANLNPDGIQENLINTFKSQISEQQGNQRLIRLMLNHPHITPDELEKIKNPVLVFAGSNDVIKEEHTKLIHRLIKGSELKIILNASHYIPFEQPDELNKISIDFLQN